MGGFGFSPTDIIEFGKFAYKVIVALKEEEGSKLEFQEAINCCVGFQDVLKEINNLALSNVTTSFADKLEVQTKRTQEFIANFKKRITKYEKAMGEKSAKGANHGTGRKMQWALQAAEELRNFRESLLMHIKSLEMFMSSRILANADQIPSLGAQTSQARDSVLILQHSVSRLSVQQNSTSSQIQDISEQIRFLRGIRDPSFIPKVAELTHLITQLLATRTEAQIIAGLPRVWKLPDRTNELSIANALRFSVQHAPLQTRDVAVLRSEQVRGHRIEPVRQEPVDDLQSNTQSSLPFSRDVGWVGETNEVLRALQIPDIPAEEFGDYRIQTPWCPEREGTEEAHTPYLGETCTNDNQDRIERQRFDSAALMFRNASLATQILSHLVSVSKAPRLIREI